MGGLRVQHIETHCASFRALGPHAVADRLLGVFGYEGFEFTLGALVLEDISRLRGAPIQATERTIAGSSSVNSRTSRSAGRGDQHAELFCVEKHAQLLK